MSSSVDTPAVAEESGRRRADRDALPSPRGAVRAGDHISGHEILAPVSAGGMATVYLARRVGAAGFAKHVAIKVVHAHLALDRAFVKMFLAEARLSARIEHPNVVQVHDLGEHDGSYFMVMEYVEGCALSELQRVLAAEQRRLAPEVAVAIAMRVAAGLHAAHELADEHGNNLCVVHRDVSPQNVLLARKGHVKLIDFGIAKAAERTQSTQGGVLKGKVRYMAPEQASGSEIDRRADVYALGVLLWEMLTGRRLFDAPTDLLALKMVLDPKPRAPSALASGIPPALDEAVLAALAKDPARRPATAQAFGEMLARALPASLVIDAPRIAEIVGVLADVARGDAADRPDSTPGVAPWSDAARERVEQLTLPALAATADASLSSAEPSVPTPVVRGAGPLRVALAMLGAVVIAASAAAWYSGRGERAAAASPRDEVPPRDTVPPRDAPPFDHTEVEPAATMPVPPASTAPPAPTAMDAPEPRAASTTSRSTRRTRRPDRSGRAGSRASATTIDDVPLDTEFE
ncbi:serine/threonine-protein kinase [Sandaracinus amylolyticus]|uniref:serine/threonine-protein kinase n=1 Tax=Sandaracinus amylolyticus TaxID=927083 RepID=UPI00146FF3C0|nr:serine/threonine-protein kinase [Sandaracinus amylolyticus]